MITETSFSYDGLHSDNFGVIKVRVEGGLVTDTFLSTSNVNYSLPRNRRKARIESIEREPLVIPMALYFDENLDDTTIRRVKNWLSKDNYKKLIIGNKVYYAILSDETPITHNAISSGYIKCNMLTNSPYTFSETIEIEGISNSLSPTSLLLNNDGDMAITVDIEISMTADGNIEIENITNGETLRLNGNFASEKIMFLGDSEEIHTSIPYMHRYGDHNDTFIQLETGSNELIFKGDFTCKITMEYVYK
ncbi:hypothetical protein QT711_03075 [Sporosarcina saromensis]|uniref:Phage tail-like C-terminal domain-containing protein n=1 Tax=Sporosarcina saromensis TaxID=359365 RepID=A0ABU4G5B6_9BACL|nr:phage tail domain-containing protein [Sporosarcina saromensis]MDW0112152.1 hypothetical protein [Sporosarcina saromensis]